MLWNTGGVYVIIYPLSVSFGSMCFESASNSYKPAYFCHVSAMVLFKHFLLAYVWNCEKNKVIFLACSLVLSSAVVCLVTIV